MDNVRNEWWRGASIYHIYPLSFCDTNADGWGDLPGVTSKLEYIASLGVDGIWLSPFYSSPLLDYGYDTTDQKAIGDQFGSLSDFDQLLDRAHGLGLKVMVDQVYTYTSNWHPWFQASRQRKGNKDDWYVWADAKADGSAPNNWLAIFGGPAWEWDIARGQYYMTHFMPGMPHLNIQNPEVQQALLEVGRFWLDRGVDGFRLDVINLGMVDPLLRDNPISGDSAPYLPSRAQRFENTGSLPENFKFIRRIREMSDSRPGQFLLGEVSSNDFLKTAREYSTGSDRLHSSYYLLGAQGGLLTAALLKEQLESWNDEDSWPTWSFSNHDSVRGLTRCGGPDAPLELSILLLAVLAMSRGTALIYQGDELGLPDAKLSFEELKDPASRRYYPDYMQRDGARTPMPWSSELPYAGFSSGKPWLPVADEHHALAVEVQETDSGSVLAWSRRLLRLRRTEDTIKTGSIRFIDMPEPLMAFVRMGSGSEYICVFNISDKETVFSLPDAVGVSERLSRQLEQLGPGRCRLGAWGFACLKRGS